MPNTILNSFRFPCIIPLDPPAIPPWYIRYHQRPHLKDEEAEARETETSTSGHTAGKDLDLRSLAREPSGWALALCYFRKLYPSQSSAKLEAKPCTCLHGLPTDPSLGDVGSGKIKESQTSLGPPCHGGTRPLAMPAAPGTFRWLSREVSLWPALVPCACAMPPPPPPPIHVWNSCVCATQCLQAAPRVPTTRSFLLLPTPHSPHSQPVYMSRANCPFQRLAFPNGKISSESFKGKMGVLETAMKTWSFSFFFLFKYPPYPSCRDGELKWPPAYCFSQGSQFQPSSHCVITWELNLHTSREDRCLVLFSSSLKKKPQSQLQA